MAFEEAEQYEDTTMEHLCARGEQALKSEDTEKMDRVLKEITETVDEADLTPELSDIIDQLVEAVDKEDEPY